jgi:hypothetical protein
MPNEKHKPIEKPWGVVGVWPYYFVRIVEEWGAGNLLVKDSETQQYSPFSWNPKVVERFSSYSEAIEHYLILKGDTSRRGKIIENILRRFSTAIKQESYQRMHDILSAYSQSQPLCTEQLSSNNLETMGWFDHWFEKI